VVFSDKLSRVACVAFVLDVTQKNNHTWLFFFVVMVQPTLLFVLFLGCCFGLHMFLSLINICVCVILLGVILSLSLPLNLSLFSTGFCSMCALRFCSS